MCENKECLAKALDMWADMYSKKDQECQNLMRTIGMQSVELMSKNEQIEKLQVKVKELEDELEQYRNYGTGT